MSEEHRFGELTADLPPHPLLPEGFTFSMDDIPVVTDWGAVLPPVEFSSQQLALLQSISRQPRLTDSPPLTALAKYLAPKISFDPSLGCWKLPLKSEYDDNGVSRYPQVSIAELGYRSEGAHRVTVEVLMGVSPEGMSVDHRCMSHACCNPYHLEAVSPAINNDRKIWAGRSAVQPTLTQLSPGSDATYSEVLARSSYPF